MNELLHIIDGLIVLSMSQRGKAFCLKSWQFKFSILAFLYFPVHGVVGLILRRLRREAKTTNFSVVWVHLYAVRYQVYALTLLWDSPGGESHGQSRCLLR